MSVGLMMASHAAEALTDFGSPPTARQLVQRIVQVGRYDSREAQRCIQIALDRGAIRVGRGMRLELPA